MSRYGICFLDSAPSVSEAISKLNGISKSQLIKRGISKKFLNTSVERTQYVEFPLDVLNFGKINPVYHGHPVSIIKETETVLALNKPSQIYCHPLRYEESDNILSYLRAQGRQDILQVNHSNYDRGLLYRLDYETSGLLLMAKDNATWKFVRDNFHSLTKEKSYLAEVRGKLFEQMSLTHRLKPSGERGSFIKEASDGKVANIQVFPIEALESSTIVEVQLKEGLRHQIRAQLSLAGFPIIGDPLYGDSEKDDILRLHCWKYEIDTIGKFQGEYPSWYTP
ncbi:MAG: hypothetical protein CME65_01930 [Halobacteriovoraceae bacterium]|nr:hypothetical protein [Halobacteriovoraceae bacterium]|tara:strand:- start:4536 stop:5375 length:840 start_codon:yes stop_codon:yes gene_type:complete